MKHAHDIYATKSLSIGLLKPYFEDSDLKRWLLSPLNDPNQLDVSLFDLALEFVTPSIFGMGKPYTAAMIPIKVGPKYARAINYGEGAPTSVPVRSRKTVFHYDTTRLGEMIEVCHFADYSVTITFISATDEGNTFVYVYKFQDQVPDDVNEFYRLATSVICIENISMCAFCVLRKTKCNCPTDMFNRWRLPTKNVPLGSYSNFIEYYSQNNIKMLRYYKVDGDQMIKLHEDKEPSERIMRKIDAWDYVSKTFLNEFTLFRSDVLKDNYAFYSFASKANASNLLLLNSDDEQGNSSSNRQLSHSSLLPWSTDSATASAGGSAEGSVGISAGQINVTTDDDSHPMALDSMVSNEQKREQKEEEEEEEEESGSFNLLLKNDPSDSSGEEDIDSTTAPTEVNQPSSHSKQKSFLFCDICKKSFFQKSNLVRHVKMIHQAKPAFFCSTCNEPFRHLKNFQQHMTEVHNEKKLFYCAQCDTNFTTKPNLVRHMQDIHRKIKNYSCDQCGKKFYQKTGFNRHLKSSFHMQRTSEGQPSTIL